jgi:hypothetical protein
MLLHERADPIKALRKREITHLQISILLLTFLLLTATINNSLFVITLKKQKKKKKKKTHSVMPSENHK